MKLMLAEDEPGLSRALTAILQHSDYEVDTALDGLTALEYLLANDYDAGILDIMMPGMDGIEVLKRTREAGKRLPIIMLTAKSEVSDKVEGLDAGANDYLTKPFAAKELLARIRAMTRAATAIDATTLSVGNVRLDTAACTLVGPLGEEHLANREFQLMELFMCNAGTRIPTERLMLEVWGEDAPEGANVVWVYISYLRKKLTALVPTWPFAHRATRAIRSRLSRKANKRERERVVEARDGKARHGRGLGQSGARRCCQRNGPPPASQVHLGCHGCRDRRAYAHYCRHQRRQLLACL